MVDTDDQQLAGKPARADKVIERREDKTFRKISRRTENHDRGRRRWAASSTGPGCGFGNSLVHSYTAVGYIAQHAPEIDAQRPASGVPSGG